MSGPQEVKQNKQALFSLGLAIVTLMLAPLAPIISLVTGFFAITAGLRGLRTAKQLKGHRRELAIAGITLGTVGIILSIALLLLPIVQPTRLFGSPNREAFLDRAL